MIETIVYYKKLVTFEIHYWKVVSSACKLMTLKSLMACLPSKPPKTKTAEVPVDLAALWLYRCLASFFDALVGIYQFIARVSSTCTEWALLSLMVSWVCRPPFPQPPKMSSRPSSIKVAE